MLWSNRTYEDVGEVHKIPYMLVRFYDTFREKINGISHISEKTSVEKEMGQAYLETALLNPEAREELDGIYRYLEKCLQRHLTDGKEPISGTLTSPNQ